jgi:hypothetical protein
MTHTATGLKAREDDEVRILEGLRAFVVAVSDDEVIVETEDGRPKWIKLVHLEPEHQAPNGQGKWREVPRAA